MKSGKGRTGGVPGPCRGVQVRVGACRGMQVHGGVCRSLQVHAGPCRCVQVLAGACRWVQALAGVCRCVQVCRSLRVPCVAGWRLLGSSLDELWHAYRSGRVLTSSDGASLTPPAQQCGRHQQGFHSSTLPLPLVFSGDLIPLLSFQMWGAYVQKKGVLSMLCLWEPALQAQPG